MSEEEFKKRQQDYLIRRERSIRFADEPRSTVSGSRPLSMIEDDSAVSGLSTCDEEEEETDEEEEEEVEKKWIFELVSKISRFFLLQFQFWFIFLLVPFHILFGSPVPCHVLFGYFLVLVRFRVQVHFRFGIVSVLVRFRSSPSSVPFLFLFGSDLVPVRFRFSFDSVSF